MFTFQSIVLIVLAGIALAAGDWLRRTCGAARRLHDELDGKMAGLQKLLALVRGEADRLEAAIKRVETLRPTIGSGSLVEMEDLADPCPMRSSAQVAQVAAQLSQQCALIPVDVFTRDSQALAISNFADQGLNPAEIARRLGLPIGEVELLLNLRPT